MDGHAALSAARKLPIAFLLLYYIYWRHSILITGIFVKVRRNLLVSRTITLEAVAVFIVKHMVMSLFSEVIVHSTTSIIIVIYRAYIIMLMLLYIWCFMRIVRFYAKSIPAMKSIIIIIFFIVMYYKN